MGHIGLQKHGLPWLQGEQVQEVDGKASDITWVLPVQLQQEAPTDVLHIVPSSHCKSQSTPRPLRNTQE